MAATVDIRRLLGTAPGQTGSAVITGLNTRMKQSDTHATGGTDNPIPAVTTNYSYWATMQLQVSVAPTNGITNLQWYTDSANNFGTGITCSGNSATTYVQATSAIVLSGPAGGNHSGLTATPVDVFTFTSGSPKSIGGTIANTVGYIGGTTNGMFVYQLAVTSSAAPGTTGSETFTWQYDET